jgi:hypothetical protein
MMEGSAGGFFAKMEESGWLRHVRLIMMASALAAEKLHFEGTSVDTLSIHLLIYLTYLSIYLLIYLSSYLLIYLFI